MYIRVPASGIVSLQDDGNMRAFAIVEEVHGAAADNQYRLDANLVIELSRRQHDQQCLNGFRNMLEGMAAYGFYDRATKQVKAKVELFDD